MDIGEVQGARKAYIAIVAEYLVFLSAACEYGRTDHFITEPSELSGSW
jgi:hypothetical protein